MATVVPCLDHPPTILRARMCVSELSKNMKGTLRRTVERRQTCASPACVTLKTVHDLVLAPRRHRPCDSALAGPLAGRIRVARLVTAYRQDGEHRGFHAGDFVWAARGVRITGRMSGVTNAGTHRRPVFGNCQSCDARGYMEGRLCGRVTRTSIARLRGCQIVATYRIRFDPSLGGGEGAVTGTLEGVVVCPCR